MNKVHHLFLTRFNLRSGGREKNIRQSKDWLKTRFQLFEDYCFPSMLAQTRRDFSWLIYFDSETPEYYKSRVIEYQQQMPDLKPVWVKPSKAIHVASDVLSIANRVESSHILTTRLDNDDGIHQDFVHKLREVSDSYLQEHTPQVFNFSQGYILAKNRLYCHQDTSNPFSSLLESTSSPKTIWGAQHVNIGTLGNLHQIDSEPMWLQVIHSNNVRNRIKGKRVLMLHTEAFCLPEEHVIESNPVRVYIENNTLGLIRRLFEAVLDAGKKTLNRFR